MCGLAGVMIGPQKGDQEIARFLLKELLAKIESRGTHATGVGVFAEGDKPGRIWKVAEKASVVLPSKSFNDWLVSLPEKSRIFMGHTRWGTHGANDKNENAHPFQKGRVIGAHNGMITNYRDLAKEHQVEVPTVDSEIVFTLLDRYKDPTKVLPQLEGNFALTWIKNGKLMACKSDGAQLAFAYVPSLHMLVWASTQYSLCRAIEAVGITHGEYSWYPPKNDMIYRFDANRFDDKGTNRETVVCEFQRRRSFFRGSTNQTTAVTRYSPTDYSEWDYYKDPVQPSLWKPSQTAQSRAKVEDDPTGAVTGKETHRVYPKDAEKQAPRLGWQQMETMIEVLIQDRVANRQTIERLWRAMAHADERIKELERQVDMIHDAFGGGCGVPYEEIFVDPNKSDTKA